MARELSEFISGARGIKATVPERRSISDELRNLNELERQKRMSMQTQMQSQSGISTSISGIERERPVSSEERRKVTL